MASNTTANRVKGNKKEVQEGAFGSASRRSECSRFSVFDFRIQGSVAIAAKNIIFLGDVFIYTEKN